MLKCARVYVSSLGNRTQGHIWANHQWTPRSLLPGVAEVTIKVLRHREDEGSMYLRMDQN